MIRTKIWGCRGSTPTAGPEYSRYGGNTLCLDIRDEDGTILVLDAGTGIIELGRDLAGKVKVVHLLLTHLHMDHIQGLGFFAPLFNPEVKVHIWGPASTSYRLQSRLRRYLSPPLFPVRLRDLPAEVILHEQPDAAFDIGPFHISSMMVLHPGPTLGYRIESPKGIITYIPDHEPALGLDNFPLEPEWTSGYALAAGADLFFHDSQFNDKEYLNHVGWGHSSLSHTLKLAALAEVKTVVPFHHDPAHNDEALDNLFADVIDNSDYNFEVIPAVEGATFQFD